MSLRTKDIEDILRNLWVKEKEDKDIMTEDQIDKVFCRIDQKQLPRISC